MILFIDTATEKTRIALVEKDKVVIQKSWISKHNQSQELLPEIDKLLKRQKIKLSALKGVVVVKGPGSFTGLRVGVSIANALVWSLNIPVVGMPAKEVSDKKITLAINKALKNSKVFQKIVLPKYKS